MRFVSKRKEFRLIIRPTEVVVDEARRPHVVQGEKVEFKQGRFTTEDRSLIDYLLHHPLYGLQFTSEIGNDPVAIQKYSLVFDDGAELSGPKVVAGFPEKNKHVDMYTGANSTANNPVQTKLQPKLPVTKEEFEKARPIAKEEIEALIDSKLDAFLDKIGSLVIQPKVKHSIKKFHCPICGDEFPNGVLVGKHKKLAHPER